MGWINVGLFRTGATGIGIAGAEDGGAGTRLVVEVVVGDDAEAVLSSSLEVESPLGGGDGVVCNVVVDSTGLVVCEPSDLDDDEQSSSSVVPEEPRAESSLARLALRSIQSIPLNHIASSRSSRMTSSSDILEAFRAGSTPSAVHSMTILRTRLRMAGDNTLCMARW